MPSMSSWSIGFSGSSSSALGSAPGSARDSASTSPNIRSRIPPHTAAGPPRVTSGRHRWLRCGRARGSRGKATASVSTGRGSISGAGAGGWERVEVQVMARSSGTCRAPRIRRGARAAGPDGGPHRSCLLRAASAIRRIRPPRSAPYAVPMTAPAPSAPVTPSVRAPRAWATAGAQTLLSLVVGLFLLLIVFGELLVEFADDPPDAPVAMHGLDLVVGLVLSLAIGPLRFVPAGRAQAVLHLVIAAAGGISSFALPASAI